MSTEIDTTANCQPDVRKRTNRSSSSWNSLKMLGNIIYLFFMLVPCIIWSIVEPFFSKKKSLKGQVALVTGAGGGIGRELCLQLAKAGCRVACADINDQATEETMHLIKEKYPQSEVFWYKCDVSSTQDIQRLHSSILKDMGPVQLLINNAGILRGGNFQNIKDETLTQILNVNLKSHFLMIREFLPNMLKNGGHIVAMGSTASLMGAPNMSEYVAAKYGVFGLMESLRYELQFIAKDKVTTTCICPFFIRTEPIKKIKALKNVSALPVEAAVEIMIDAIQRNKPLITIPSWIYTVVLLIKFLPVCYTDMIGKFIIKEQMKGQKILEEE